MAILVMAGILIAVVIVLGALAAVFGADTRDWDPRSESGRSI